MKESANSDLLHTVSTNTKEKQHPKKQKFSPQNGKQIFLKQKKNEGKKYDKQKKRTMCCLNLFDTFAIRKQDKRFKFDWHCYKVL